MIPNALYSYYSSPFTRFATSSDVFTASALPTTCVFANLNTIGYEGTCDDSSFGNFCARHQYTVNDLGTRSNLRIL